MLGLGVIYTVRVDILLLSPDSFVKRPVTHPIPRRRIFIDPVCQGAGDSGGAGFKPWDFSTLLP
jgi:hypothetical protein